MQRAENARHIYYHMRSQAEQDDWMKFLQLAATKVKIDVDGKAVNKSDSDGEYDMRNENYQGQILYEQRK